MRAQAIGRLRVERVLGEGGMGRVVLARDPLLGRVVAVKTLLSPSPAAHVRFAEEAQVTGQLAHPNVIAAHAYDLDDGAPFLVMRYVAGRDLKALAGALARGDAATRADYPLRRVLRLFLKVCEAVGHAHARGVIHRDLKPANVMLGHDDEVLVMDWGLAKPHGRAAGAAPQAGARLEAVASLVRAGGADLTQEGALVGTPAYMAPEQAADGTVSDPRVDVYALGALLYELLTGRRPLEGSPLEVVTALITGKPTPPAPRAAAPGAGIPPAVEAIALKALARDPAARYPDAGALAGDVAAYLDGRAVSCHREGAREALGRLVARHRPALAAGGLAALALALAVGAALAVVGGEAAAAAGEAAAAAREAAAAVEALADADRAGARARLVAAGEAVASEAAREASDVAQAARRVVPTARLRARREQAARALDALAARLDALAADPAAGDALAPARARVRAAREAVDLALARALVGRRPRLALEALPALAPGPEAPLLAARALLALERGPEAAARLAGAAWPADRPDLSAAARALALQAEDAPLEALRPAVEAALRHAPGQAWLVALGAGLAARSGDLERARDDHARALALDPTDAQAATRRLFDLVPPTVHEEFYPAATQRHVATLLAEGEPSPVGAHEALISLWHMGHLDPFCERARGDVEAGAMSARAGACLQAEGALLVQEPARAEAAAREALALAPDDREALGLLALALVGLGRHEEARAAADRGLARHPTDARLARARGEVALEEGDPARAERWLEVAARASLVPDPWTRLASACLAQDDPAAWARGVAAARRALALDVFDSWLASHQARPLTGDPRVHVVLGQLRRRQGDLAAAALHFMRARRTLDVIPRAAQALEGDRTAALLLGEVHEELGLPLEARRCYEDARGDPRLAAEAERRLARLPR